MRKSQQNERQPTEMEKIFANNKSGTEFISRRLRKTYSSIAKHIPPKKMNKKSLIENGQSN